MGDQREIPMLAAYSLYEPYVCVYDKQIHFDLRYDFVREKTKSYCQGSSQNAVHYTLYRTKAFRSKLMLRTIYAKTFTFRAFEKVPTGPPNHYSIFLSPKLGIVHHFLTKSQKKKCFMHLEMVPSRVGQFSCATFIFRLYTTFIFVVGGSIQFTKTHFKKDPLKNNSKMNALTQSHTHERARFN